MAVSTSLFSMTNAVALPTDGSVQLAPSYPERPVPQIGDSTQLVLTYYGQPAKIIASDNTSSEVWDYGTFRLLVLDNKVAYSRVW